MRISAKADYALRAALELAAEEGGGPVKGELIAQVHGHLHESRGTFTLGRTLCINPGSEYTEGLLRGALVEIERGTVRSHQFTAG